MFRTIDFAHLLCFVVLIACFLSTPYIVEGRKGKRGGKHTDHLWGDWTTKQPLEGTIRVCFWFSKRRHCCIYVCVSGGRKERRGGRGEEEECVVDGCVVVESRRVGE